MKMFFESIKILFLQLNSKKEQSVARLLFNYSMTFAAAESCTGGLISSRLTDIAGSSTFTKENFVTYSTDSKINTLGVSKKVIEQYGVVSQECAKEMVEGLFKKTNNDVCLAITGIAGPTSIEGKPPGLAYIAVKNKYNFQIKEIKLNENLNRRTLKFLFSDEALSLLLEFLESNYAAITSANIC